MDANLRYAEGFSDPDLAGKAARGLGVLTCIDSRIDPLAVLGLAPGDAKIFRNAGARVTPDVLRSLGLAANLLDVTRICIVQHTSCAMVGRTDDDVRAALTERRIDARGWEFLTSTDQEATLRADAEVLRSCPLIPASVALGAFVLDVHTGRLRPVTL